MEQSNMTREDFRPFERSQIEIFMEDHYFGDHGGKGMLEDLRPEHSDQVYESTSEGLIISNDRLARLAGEPTVYRARLRDTIQHDPRVNELERQVRELGLGLGGISDYAGYMSHAYGLFLYNESLDNFRERFPEFSNPSEALDERA